MMQDDFEPKTEPSGSLDPPSRKPPTAVGGAAPGSEPEYRKPHSIVMASAQPNWLGRFLTKAFDTLDKAADTVADSLHIGPPRSGI